MNSTDPVLARMSGAEYCEIGGIEVDTVRVGAARVKRMIYPVGFRWSTHIKPIVGTDLCTHAHVGFLARGRIHVQYADGCNLDLTAPQVVGIEPGHDAWVVGEEPAVLIEFDFAGATVSRMGMPDAHRHAVGTRPERA
jgi:hypothetical protein